MIKNGHSLQLDLGWALAMFTSYLPVVCASEPAGQWVAQGSASMSEMVLWHNGKLDAALVPPKLTGPQAAIVETTLNGFFRESYGWQLPSTSNIRIPGLYILIGNESNNAAIRELVDGGLQLKRWRTGEEGFRIFTHTSDSRRFIIVTANTPIGLKYGCQELIYFHTPATATKVAVEWPLDMTKVPAFSYRGDYILPCWSAHESLESWKRVLKFHSELTINRNWFWLAGFSLLPEWGGGEYPGTDLANLENVKRLVEYSRAEGMKFLIGGGWFNWHHRRIVEAIGGAAEHRVTKEGGEEPMREVSDEYFKRGIKYYLDLVKALPGAAGVYIEPVGEGKNADESVWSKQVDAIEQLTSVIWRQNPAFEFAVAIGRFNAEAYRKRIHNIDSTRLYWWWCWGDPLRENALAEHPLILRWHTIGRREGDYHGSNHPPEAYEAGLTGMVSSWDPGMGFGNPWNGWKKMGVDKPRDFHPYTMPFFSHQYWFRERCWNVNLTQEQFAQRLARRLFDADMPSAAADLYLKLADYCFAEWHLRYKSNPQNAVLDPPPAEFLERIEKFLANHWGKGTPRNQDTLMRMREAVDGIRRTQGEKRARR